MTGMIYLYDFNDVLLYGNKYRNVFERKNIVAKWKRLYGANFRNCYIQIAPYTYYLLKKEEKNQERPKAQYDNTTPYNIANEYR